MAKIVKEATLFANSIPAEEMFFVTSVIVYINFVLKFYSSVYYFVLQFYSRT